MAAQQNTDHIETTHIGSLPRPHKTEVHPTVVWERFKGHARERRSGDKTAVELNKQTEGRARPKTDCGSRATVPNYLQFRLCPALSFLRWFLHPAATKYR
jgi:hypothetical protein